VCRRIWYVCVRVAGVPNKVACLIRHFTLTGLARLNVPCTLGAFTLSAPTPMPPCKFKCLFTTGSTPGSLSYSYNHQRLRSLGCWKGFAMAPLSCASVRTYPIIIHHSPLLLAEQWEQDLATDILTAVPCFPFPAAPTAHHSPSMRQQYGWRSQQWPYALVLPVSCWVTVSSAVVCEATLAGSAMSWAGPAGVSRVGALSV